MKAETKTAAAELNKAIKALTKALEAAKAAGIEEGQLGDIASSRWYAEGVLAYINGQEE